MNALIRRYAIEKLSQLVRDMSHQNIRSREVFREWMKTSDGTIATLFEYDQKPGMPPIHSLVNADFHPELPLVMFNYTPVAHNTLHAHPEGWTPALRMCRGIVFEMGTGKLIAHPFPKFFNLGEHPESKIETLIEKLKSYHNDRSSGWYATRKMDGHLGIIFEYAGTLHFTTRGTFTSPSAQLGTKMLRDYEKKYDWKTNFDPNMTTLVELIDPSTKVHVNYGKKSEFVLIGAFNRETFVDATMNPEYIGGIYDGSEIRRDGLFIHGSHLKIETKGSDLFSYEPRSYASDNLRELVASMKDRDVVNAEGWVIRFFDGTRVKVKYETYIGLMVQKKLSPTYLMNRMMSGNLDRMLNTLDEEVGPAAHEMLGRIIRVLFMETNHKSRQNYLYGLVPPEESTSYYRSICRKFLVYLCESFAK